MSAELKLTPAEERLAQSLPDGELAEAMREHGLPNRREEAWKWSDLRAALKEPREPSGPYDYREADDEPLLAELGGYEIVLANGVLRAPAALPASIRISMNEPSAEIFPQAPIASLATVMPFVTIAVEESLDAPLFLRHLNEGNGMHSSRVVIALAPGVDATVIETHRFTGAPFVNSLTEYGVCAGASLTRVLLQPPAPEAISVATGLIEMEEGAKLHQLTLAGGAAFSRHETRLDFAGRGDVRLDALYRVRGRLHNDLTSHVTHGVPGVVTRQLVKGILEDKARGIFQGKFLVERDGQQTDAQMVHHALVLSGEATVNAKPELEIYADDVECAHGNTVGALDTEQLFYLQQRGLDEIAARRLLIEAFAAEVFDQLEDEKLREALRRAFEGEA